MDPALQRLIEEGHGDDEVAAIVRVTGPGVGIPPEVRVVARFGEILTVRAPRQVLHELRATEGVLSVKAPRRYRREETLGGDGEPEVTHEDLRRPRGLSVTGRGTVVAVVDWGLDFTHRAFLDEQGRTRLLALWDQQPGPDPSAPNVFGYGRIHRREAIDAALDSDDPFAALGYDASAADPGGGTHGTATASIAAGSEWPDGVAGVAPAADLVFVHFSTWGASGPQNLGDSVALAEALAFIREVAAGRPCVANLSMGRCAGPHDGSTSLERLLDHAVEDQPTMLIAQSGGNYFGERTHAEAHVPARGTVRIPLELYAGGNDIREVDLWYFGEDRLLVGLVAPDGTQRTVVRPGSDAVMRMDGRAVARLQSRLRDPNNGRNEVVVRLHSSAPAGRWSVVLIGAEITDGHVHAWIEREAAKPSRRSSFPEDFAVHTTTTGTICNGRRTVAVGAYDAHDPGRPIARFSSSGNTVDGRRKPDLLAPGRDVLVARSHPPGLPPEAVAPLGTRMSGTSMAAPFVTGALACLLEATGGTWPGDRVTAALLASCAPYTGADAIRAGAGYLDLAAAVERLGASKTLTLEPASTHTEETMTSFNQALGRPIEGFESAASEAVTTVRPGAPAITARILWPALGFPAVIAPRPSPPGGASGGHVQHSISVLLLSDRESITAEDAAQHLRIVLWSDRTRRHIPAGQPGSFGRSDLWVRNDLPPSPLSRPQKDARSDAVVFGGDGYENSVVVSLARSVRSFYARQGLRYLHEIRISEPACGKLADGQYHLFWNGSASAGDSPSDEMKLLIDRFAIPAREGLRASTHGGKQWLKENLRFLIDEYRFDYGALHHPYDEVDAQKRRTEVLHPVFVRRETQRPLVVGHITDTHVDVRADVYEENFRRAAAPISWNGHQLQFRNRPLHYNNFNRSFERAYADARRDADIILLTGDLIDYGRGHIGVSGGHIGHRLGENLRRRLGDNEAYHPDRNWFLFYYLLASGERYSKPVYTILGNHDWRLNPYPPFAPGAPDPRALVHNYEAFEADGDYREGWLKEIVALAHGPGHDTSLTYAGVDLVGAARALKHYAGGNLDLPGSPVHTTVEAVSWYLLLINPFLDYAFPLPTGQQVLMLDWGEDEEVLNFEEPRSFMGTGPRAATSLTPLQKWQVTMFARSAGKAKIVGIHAPPLGPYPDWSDQELRQGQSTYAAREDSRMRWPDGTIRQLPSHPLFAIRPPRAPLGVAADYGSFLKERDWFIRKVADPTTGIRLVVSGHIHRTGLLVAYVPASDSSALLVQSVTTEEVRDAGPTLAAKRRNGPAFRSPLYVNTTSAGPRGNRYAPKPGYVGPGFALLTLAGDGTIKSVSPRQIGRPEPSSRAPIPVARGVVPVGA